MSRYIDADNALRMIRNSKQDCPLKDDQRGIWDVAHNCCISCVEAAHTADVVEVRHDFNVGDFCLYGFTDGNKSLAIVEIVKILPDDRGIAELKFHKVIKDNTGNGFFHYLLKSGHTMNGSFEYLRNITPLVDGERKEL